jgi:hypothetical protein
MSRSGLIEPRGRAADALVAYRQTDIFKHIDSAPPKSAEGFEPTEADAGNMVMYTANFFGAYSTDYGASFKRLNPEELFPNTDGGFCCDQIVRYAPQIDRFVWLIQYGTSRSTGQNHYVLALASPAKLAADPTHAWSAYAMTNGTFGLEGKAFDFPDMQVGANDLYFSFNVEYDSAHGAVVARIPLSQLAAGDDLSFLYWPVEGRFARIAQNSDSRAYWVSIRNPETLIGYYADEGSNEAVYRDVGIQSQTTNNYCLAASDGQAVVPGFDENCPDSGPGDQGVIIHSLGSGLVSATVNRNRVWVAWTGGRNDPAGDHVYPYAEVGLAAIQFPQITNAGQSAIWSGNEAVMHPSLATNADGDVGFVLSAGNGRAAANSTPGNPSLSVDTYVGILDERFMLPFSSLDVVHESDSITGGADYQSIEPAYPDRSCFAVASYVRNAAAPGTASVDHPWSVLFGRAGLNEQCPGRQLTPPPGQRAPSALTLECGGGGEVGSPFLVIGQYHSQPSAGAQIELTYQSPNGTVYGPHYIASDQNGQFSDTVVPALGQEGVWTIHAVFHGDSYRLPESATCRFGVAPSAQPPPPPGPSTVTLSCPPVASDQFSISVSGTVAPAIAGGSVTVKYTAPSGEVTIHNETTDAHSNYVDSLALNGGASDGTWKIRAHFAGAGAQLPEDSPICETLVQGPR